MRTGAIRALLAAMIVMLLSTPLEAAGQGVTRFEGGVRADSMSADIIIPLVVAGTVANGQALEFEVPWAMQVEEVSTRAGAVTNPADGVVTVDVLDDGVSILSPIIEYAAAATTHERIGMTTAIAPGSVVRVVFVLTGTGPVLSNAVVTLTGRRKIW